MITTLYLARHGETQWNKIQRFQGQLDSNLTELGKTQSEQIAQNVLKHNIEVIFSSNLGRAVNSAQICKQTLGVNTQVKSSLTERHLGYWQGKQITTLSKDPNYVELLQKFTELTPQGGESAVTCGERIYKALEKIAIEYKTAHILVIFHGEALRCFYGYIGNNSNMNAYDLFKNGSINKLTYEHNTSSFHLTPST
ncbi:histidine phosphatase family protein [Colwellia sp. RE-S-Sl-9]